MIDDTTLRTVDAARREPDASRRAHGSQLLEAVLSENAPPTETHVASRRRRRRTGWRIGVGLSAIAAAAAGAIVLPGLLGGGTSSAWAEAGSPVEPDALAAASEACLAAAQPLTEEEVDALEAAPNVYAPEESPLDEPESDYSTNAELTGGELEVVLSEQRGDTILLLLSGGAPGFDFVEIGTCFYSIATQSVLSGGGTLLTIPQDQWHGRFFEVLPDNILAPDFVYTEGARLEYIMESTIGYVGPEVTAMTIRGQDLTVQASITDGFYTAWWPYQEAADLPLDAPSGIGPLTIELTLADGSVVTEYLPRGGFEDATLVPGERPLFVEGEDPAG